MKLFNKMLRLTNLLILTKELKNYTKTDTELSLLNIIYMSMKTLERMYKKEYYKKE